MNRILRTHKVSNLTIVGSKEGKKKDWTSVCSLIKC
jgi:hypothetical protein